MIERIEINPKVCAGKPVIKGTRIPVAVILELPASGETYESLLKGYPDLCMEDIRAVMFCETNSNTITW